MATVKKWAKGRSLKDFPNRTAAERKLSQACREGEWCFFAHERPEKATNVNTIRASFIRFLAIGGDDQNPVHEKGVQLQGAWIEGDLDLSACVILVPIYLVESTLNGAIQCWEASLRELKLNGTSIHQFLGDGVVVNGSLALKEGFFSQNSVSLVGAVISGNLECDNSVFAGADGSALILANATIKGNVYLRDNFVARSTVQCGNATIEGSFECSKAKLSPADVGALHLDGAVIRGGLLLEEIDSNAGILDFSNLRVGQLRDDLKSTQVRYVLDGFEYKCFAGVAPLSAEMRISWLKKQAFEFGGKNFRTQPWEQCIMVLREMGYPEEARKIAIAKQDEMRKAGKIKWELPHLLYGVFAGYGYRPIRIAFAMVLLWLLCAGIYFHADDRGLFGPTSTIITANSQIASVCGIQQGRRETAWTRCSAVPQEYTTFNPWLYSADLIFPLVDLQQERDWAPIVMKDDGVSTILDGAVTRWFMWVEIFFGWTASLLLVAVLSNLVKKD